MAEISEAEAAEAALHRDIEQAERDSAALAALPPEATRALALRWRGLCGRAPRSSRAWRGLGRLLSHHQEWPQAAAAWGRAHQLDPTDLGAKVAQARAVGAAGDRPGQLRLLEATLQADPAHGGAWLLAADLAHAAGDVKGELQALERCLLRRPTPLPVARRALQRALAARAPGTAAKLARLAIGQHPEDGPLWAGLGDAFYQRGELTEAEEALRRAVGLSPDDARAWDGLGVCLLAQGKPAPALRAHRRAMKLQPDLPGLRAHTAACLLLLDGLAEPVALLKEAVNQGENINQHAIMLLQPMLHLGDWWRLEAIRAAVEARVRRALAAGQPSPLQPLHGIANFDDPALNLAIARSRAPAPKSARPRALPVEGPLTLLYLSHDVRNHPMGHLMAGVYRRHDRERLRVLLLSTGRDDGSPWRARAEADCDGFFDMHGQSEAAIAAQVEALQPHIFIDLMGLTVGNRQGLFARRLAPLQLTWLGFPGSTGGAYFDGVIVDRVLGRDPAHFSEPTLALPTVYQPTDADQPPVVLDGTRADHGLPEQGLVFCSFNQVHKIDPTGWAGWMCLLREAPGSALWLLDYGPLVRGRLRAAATAAGIDPDRLVFAPFVDRAAHLNRLGHADLGVDTRVYGGHTTTSDALRAGVPVITVMGRHFASQVAASILIHAGLERLVFPDLAAQVAFVRAWAADPDARAALRAEVAQCHGPGGIFDTDHFVRGLDDTLLAAWSAQVAADAGSADAEP